MSYALRQRLLCLTPSCLPMENVSQKFIFNIGKEHEEWPWAQLLNIPLILAQSGTSCLICELGIITSAAWQYCKGERNVHEKSFSRAKKCFLIGINYKEKMHDKDSICLH